MTRTLLSPFARLMLASGVVLSITAAGLAEPARSARGVDADVARFGACDGPARVTCVVDGDTFWYRGTKIRIADINAPETGAPHCVREAELGAAATRRLTALLNAGPFSLVAWPGRDTDRFGRALRVVSRRGESLGTILTAEGLAEPWRGRRGDWCSGGR